MESSSPFYAYKEVRLDLDPVTQGSTIAIRLPKTTTSTPAFSSRTAPKRSQIAEIAVALDENSFRQKFLATDASIYYRNHHKSPRSFLWRVLEDGKVLSIRAVDISKQADILDASLTLHISFSDAILPGCIALSDSKEHDALSVFVLTDSKQLYTLTLRPDFFRRPSSTEDNISDWCKSYSSSVFTFKQPHRLVALTADELFVPLHDGSLLKLDRGLGSDGIEGCSYYYLDDC